MNCEDFEAWLDAGSPSSQERDALAHAATCATCGGAARAAAGIERLLRQAPEPAPQDFTANVMARIAASRAASPASGITLATRLQPRLAFFRRLAVEPATSFAVACGTVALVVPSIVSHPGVASTITTPFLRLLSEASRSAPLPSSVGARTALEWIALLGATALGVGLAQWTARAAGPTLHGKTLRR